MISRIKNSVLYTAYGIATKRENPKILSRIETANKIKIHKKLSLSRLGDGELGMVIGKSNIGFQEYNASLAYRLQTILTSCNNDLLVCIPDVFETVASMANKPKMYWQSWVLNNKKALMKYLNKNTVYGDTNVTRLFVAWKDKRNEASILTDLREAWGGYRLVIVEGEKSRCGVGNDLFDNASIVERILCPAENAWDKYTQILDVCLSYPKDENLVFYLALGPTASVLAYDLCNAGYRALDLGHLDLQYEYMLRGMEEKGIIPGKYNNEVNYRNVVDDIIDQRYSKSIVAKVY